MMRHGMLVIVMPCHLLFHHCLYSESACVKCIVLCIISSYKPLFAAWSAFLLPGIPVWAGIQLIVGLCVNLEAPSLMALVIVFKSSFLLFSLFIAVKEYDYVCIVILSLVSLSSSSATRMAVISASNRDAESLSLMIIYSPLCTTASTTRVLTLEPSV